jgi:hypothetical protein
MLGPPDDAAEASESFCREAVFGATGGGVGLNTLETCNKEQDTLISDLNLIYHCSGQLLQKREGDLQGVYDLFFS